MVLTFAWYAEVTGCPKAGEISIPEGFQGLATPNQG